MRGSRTRIDRIGASLFVDDVVEFDKYCIQYQTTRSKYLILRRGALSSNGGLLGYDDDEDDDKDVNRIYHLCKFVSKV